MNKLGAWAYALRGGFYRDVRCELPHSEWCYLKQVYREHPLGEGVMMYNPLGVLAEVMGCEFVPVSDAVHFDVVSSIVSPVDVYFRELSAEDMHVVRSVIAGSEGYASAEGYFKAKPFDRIADEIDRANRRIRRAS